MNFKHRLTAFAVVGLLNMAPTVVMAATLNTGAFEPGSGQVAAPNDGVLQNFTGIDWHSNGAGYVEGFTLNSGNLAGDFTDITFTYQAFAVGINSPTATPNLRIASPGAGGGAGYEYTTISVIQERATCVNDGCSVVSFQVNGPSTWDVYFDATPDADQSAGTGFLDGTKILSGTWDSQAGIFSAIGGAAGSPGGFGTGSASLLGTVTFTDNNFVNPDLEGTTFQSSLQFPGENPPDYTRPTNINGAPAPDVFGPVIGGIPTLTAFVLQVDSSQNFTSAVPIPSTILLMGSALLGLGGFSKRKRA